MNLTQKTISLFYTGGGSDKVYQAQIEMAGGGRAVVNFQFGRRGSNLASGTKTREPVPLAEAEAIFDRIVAEKKGKGYTEAVDGIGQRTEGGSQRAELEALKPRKTIVSIEDARRWSGDGYLIQRKYDGDFQTRQYGAALLLGELVRQKSGGFFTAADKALMDAHGSFFAAFTVANVAGQDFLAANTRTRAALLRGLASGFNGDMILAETVTDIDAAMRDGAEGVCAHEWAASWGEMLCYKANEIYVCRVSSRGGSQSVGIEDAQTGDNRGNVKLGGGKCDQVQIGSIIRVEGIGLTDTGKIRQPVTCREWLVKY